MIFGLGLEKAGSQPKTLTRAFELGVKFFDTAPTYGNGSSELKLGDAIKGLGLKRKNYIISTKTHLRKPQEALQLLDKSLEQLQTDYIDIWSIHDLSTPYDVAAYPALVEAKKSGKVKAIGITCNRDPMLLKQVLQDYKFDYVMMTMNIADKHHLSFIDNVLPVIGDAKLIAMQVFMRGLSRYQAQSYMRAAVQADKHQCPQDRVQMNLIWTKTTPTSARWSCPQCPYVEAEDPHGHQVLQDCMNYVASFPVEVMLIGCNGVDQLEQDFALFNAIKKVRSNTRSKLEETVLPFKEVLNSFKVPYNPKHHRV